MWGIYIVWKSGFLFSIRLFSVLATSFFLIWNISLFLGMVLIFLRNHENGLLINAQALGVLIYKPQTIVSFSILSEKSRMQIISNCLFFILNHCIHVREISPWRRSHRVNIWMHIAIANLISNKLLSFDSREIKMSQLCICANISMLLCNLVILKSELMIDVNWEALLMQ